MAGVSTCKGITMRRTSWLAVAGTVLTSASFAQNFTQDNVDQVTAVIDAATEAYGGEAAVSGLTTLVVEARSVNHAVGQSRGTEPPWDRNESQSLNAIDLQESIFANRAEFNGGGFETRTGTVIDGDESVRMDYRAGTVARIAEPNFAQTSGPFVRVTPVLLLRALKERAANAHYLGQVTVDGRPQHAIGFSMTVGPAITLYFDRETHLLTRSERMFAGAGLVRYEFSDYAMIDGIPFNRRFRLFLNDDLNSERSIVSVAINAPLDAHLVVDERLKAIPEVAPDPLTRQEVADGVWLIGGSGTYAMFVDMGGFVFAAGGTAGIGQRIDSLREVVGDKPIRYGMLTHHHFDHVVGVPDYEREGATVLAAAAHETVVREAGGEALKFEAVVERQRIESSGRTVEIIDIGPTAHTEHLLVAYLPEEGVLFEADHFALPASGPIPPAVSSTRTFAEALERAGLDDVRYILSAHSPRFATPADLATALEAEMLPPNGRD